METRDKAGEMGQVCWKRKREVWEVRHIQDQDAVGQLRGVATLDELEEVVRWDEQGKYRPLRSEGNLVSGWQYDAKSVSEFREAMEVIYPGLWGNAEAWRDGRLKFQTWDEALAKQTERVRQKIIKAGDLPQRVIEENCKRRCLKTVLWAGERSMDGVKSVPMLCTGPCGMFWSCVES
jgi:DR2241 stabilising domain